MATKYFTVHGLARIWASLVLIYLVRAWANVQKLTMPKEIFLYIVVFVFAFCIDTFIWPTREEMGREESDLVQEYIRYRNKGETLGQYLARLEKEEEDSIRLHEDMLFGKGKRQNKKQKRNG